VRRVAQHGDGKAGQSRGNEGAGTTYFVKRENLRSDRTAYSEGIETKKKELPGVQFGEDGCWELRLEGAGWTM
jgi:hypothetical protein